MTLHRAGKPIPPNVICFDIDPEMTKPELKQYLVKLYNMKIVSIYTARRGKKYKMGEKTRSKLNRTRIT